MGLENRKQNRFALHRTDTREQSAASSDGSFLYAAYRRKKMFLHTALDGRHESSPHRARITTKLGGCMLH